ncbi:hypothetical protein KAR48_00535 [bacterium]|nr:hypothetical protein [bacterium]
MSTIKPTSSTLATHQGQSALMKLKKKASTDTSWPVVRNEDGQTVDEYLIEQIHTIIKTDDKDVMKAFKVFQQLIDRPDMKQVNKNHKEVFQMGLSHFMKRVSEIQNGTRHIDATLLADLRAIIVKNAKKHYRKETAGRRNSANILLHILHIDKGTVLRYKRNEKGELRFTIPNRFDIEVPVSAAVRKALQLDKVIEYLEKILDADKLRNVFDTHMRKPYGRIGMAVAEIDAYRDNLIARLMNEVVFDLETVQTLLIEGMIGGHVRIGRTNDAWGLGQWDSVALFRWLKENNNHPMLSKYNLTGENFARLQLLEEEKHHDSKESSGHRQLEIRADLSSRVHHSIGWVEKNDFRPYVWQAMIAKKYVNRIGHLTHKISPAFFGSRPSDLGPEISADDQKEAFAKMKAAHQGTWLHMLSVVFGLIRGGSERCDEPREYVAGRADNVGKQSSSSTTAGEDAALMLFNDTTNSLFVSLRGVLCRGNPPTQRR